MGTILKHRVLRARTVCNIINNDTYPAHPDFRDDASEWSTMATKLAVADQADSP